jgi:hypothetical protein|tara:strand:- start:457 stop:987 length:531 start_codon:yes stop_codon:yes gene_type:complete
MVSKIEVDTVVNQTGDQDSGLDLSTNDAVKIKIANSVKAEVDSSGHVKLDTVKGYTSAASVNVVGEGGSTTTNLQQGLSKCWIQLNGTGTIATQDSLNVSSIGDNGTGFYVVNINNDMANNDYSLTAGIGRINGSGSGVIMHHHILVEANLFNFYNQTTGTEDVTVVCGTAHGDLA